MNEYQIVCKELKQNGSINRVGLAPPGENASKVAKTPDQVNQMIGQGDKCFFTDEKGDVAEVDQLGDDFIRTKPDGIVHNNLGHLRDCSFSSK